MPYWNPLDWNVGYLLQALENICTGGQFLTVFVRTLLYVGHRDRRSRSLIGYPVAYYAARHAGRWKCAAARAADPAVLDQLPDADVRLDQPARRRTAGRTRVLHATGIERLFLAFGLLSTEGGWLGGQPSTVIMALVYGYVPFLILPLFAALDRIDQRQIEAARDLGASPFDAFRRVTLPLSMPGMLAGIVLIALPMFGDYYTPDLMSGSPKTSMIGNQIDQLRGRARRRSSGAALTHAARGAAARADALLPARRRARADDRAQRTA